MKTRRSPFRPITSSLIGGVLLGLLAAAPAHAQSATSTFTPTASGTVGTPTTTKPGGAIADGPEAISCSGPVKITTTTVTDPALGPQVVVYLDLRSVSCVGQSTKTVYLNSGQANLTRPFGATDTVQTTFALYPNTAGGYLNARTGLATVTLNYNTTTGALTGATASIGNF